MTLEFLGAAHEVTGSCTLLTVGDTHILIDCGMEQGRDMYENGELPVAPEQIDALILTHAHIDHAGKIPLLAARGFRGAVWATEGTVQLCRIMLLDSAHIQEFEAEWRNRKAKRAGDRPYTPLYTTADATAALSLMRPVGYHQPIDVADGVTAEFFDAGHLLGSACVRLTVREDGKETVLLFSGDLGNVSRPLIRDPEAPPAADTVVIESTYGDRLHGAHPDYVAQLTRVLQDTFDRGGNVVIPAFAVGRTQEMLYCLRQIKEQGLLRGHDRFPVWVDSPLAVEATRIYRQESLETYFDDDATALLARGVDPILFPDLHTAVTSDESRAINADKTPKVILSASGMCEAGRIRHHLKHNLWRPECTVLFVGYQTEGTLGNQLLGGAKTVKLFGETIQVKAAIENMDGISGHADREHLLGWLAAMPQKPRQVFVNHGHDTVCDDFAAAVTEKIGAPATAPYPGGLYTADGRCLREGNRQRLERPASKRAQTVFERLQTLYRALGVKVESSRGRANKDLAKMADQLQSLIDRWD